MSTQSEPAVVFSQTASWNPKLTNPYRTRWATVAGRYFKVRSNRMDAPWLVDEVDADGEYLGPVAVVFRLSDARTSIRSHIEATK